MFALHICKKLNLKSCLFMLTILTLFTALYLLVISEYLEQRFKSRLNEEIHLIQAKLDARINEEIKETSNLHFFTRPIKSSPIIIATSACGEEPIVFEQILVLIKSALILSSSNLHFIILTDVLQDKIAKELSTWPETYTKRLTYDTKLPKFPARKWEMMYRQCSTARLFLPSILPETDVVMYLDVDTLFLSNVEQLWRYFEEMSSTQMIGLIREAHHPKYGWWSSYGYKYYKDIPFIPPIPFNAGVLLLNLTRMRANNFQSEAMEIYYNHSTAIGSTADQGVINIYVHNNPNRLLEIPCKWNYYDDHCMHDSDLCGSAEQMGIGLLHHHSKFQYDHALNATFQVFKRHTLTNNQYLDIVSLNGDLVSALLYTNSRCNKSLKQFLFGLKLYEKILKINNETRSQSS